MLSVLFGLKIDVRFFLLEAAPIPFEKDDDFQIDFIVAATVCGFHNQRISIRKSLLEFKSANVPS